MHVHSRFAEYANRACCQIRVSSSTGLNEVGVPTTLGSVCVVAPDIAYLIINTVRRRRFAVMFAHSLRAFIVYDYRANSCNMGLGSSLVSAASHPDGHSRCRPTRPITPPCCAHNDDDPKHRPVALYSEGWSDNEKIEFKREPCSTEASPTR